MKISAAQAYCILDTVGSSILTKSGEFPYLVYHMGTGHMNADPFQHRHIKLAVCLLQSAVRNIYFHPVGQIPFITNGKEYPFLLPDPYHIGTLYIP